MTEKQKEALARWEARADERGLTRESPRADLRVLASSFVAERDYPASEATMLREAGWV